MKKNQFSRKAIFLIVILYAAIFWFDHKLKESGLKGQIVENQPILKDTPGNPIYKKRPESFRQISESEKAPLNAKVRSALRKTQNRQRFIENKGQMPKAVSYYTDNENISFVITDNSIRMTSTKKGEVGTRQRIENHAVDLVFAGGNPLHPQPVAGNLITYNYFISQENQHSNISSFGELMIPGIYDGVDLRLYSNEAGQVEFDWLVTNPEDFRKIRMKFNGQDYLRANSEGGLNLGLRFADMELSIPESYQVVGKEKKKVHMTFRVDENEAAFSLAKNEKLVSGAPLVIDPLISGATFFDGGNTSISSSTDGYAIGIDGCGGIIAAGLTVSQVTSAYVSGSVGYDQSFLNGLSGTGHGMIFRISGSGVCTNFTFFGTNTQIECLKIFPNGRIIVSGGLSNGNVLSTDIPTTPGAFIGNPRPNNSYVFGFVAVLSSDLSTLHYSSYLPGKSGVLGSSQLGVGAVEVLDDNNFFVSGIIVGSNNATAMTMPAGFISPGAPDQTHAGAGDLETYIARFSGAGYNQLDWATYVGGGQAEEYSDLEISPDKTMIGFAGETNSATGWPARTANNVGNTISGGKGIYLGYLPTGITPPTTFPFLTFFDGSRSETRPILKMTNQFFYMTLTTDSKTIQGTAVSPAVYQSQNADPTGAFTTDIVITRIPVDGTSSGIPVRSTFLGATLSEMAGGMVVNDDLNEIYVFGTSTSTGAQPYPTVNISGSDYFKSTHSPNVSTDYVISILNTDLTTLKYSTYLGGQGNETLGGAGSSDIIGDGQLVYDKSSGRIGLIGTITGGGTQTSIPNNYAPLVFGPNSFDSVTASTTRNLFAFSFGTRDKDFGDAPASYDAGLPACHSNNLNALKTPYARFGSLVDLELGPQPTINADGDDNDVSVIDVDKCGLPNLSDEDGISSGGFPRLSAASGGIYSINVSVYKNTANAGDPAYVSGWIDFNGNGAFEPSERATTSFMSNKTQTTVALSWNLANYSCGSTIIPGDTYCRIRIGTNNAEISNPTGSAANGEVEDYMLSILGTDFGDLPVGGAVAYPVASALCLSDADPDKIWLGDDSDMPTRECASLSNSSATGDGNDGGFVMPAIITRGVPQNYQLTVNSNTPNLVFYGIWFDWDADGTFDDFYNGSQATSSPATVNLLITAPMTTVSGFGARIIARTVPLSAADFNLQNFENGEVEDYTRSTNITLPVVGLELKANRTRSAVELNWSTVQENNTRQFIIERSTDGVNFVAIGYRDASFNSTTPRNYEFTDAATLPRVVFYRIKLTDIDGKYMLSNVVALRNEMLQTGIAVYPNPVTGGRKVSVEFKEGGEYEVMLVNAAGATLYRGHFKMVNGQVTSLNCEGYPAGLYVLKATNALTREQVSVKITLQ